MFFVLHVTTLSGKVLNALFLGIRYSSGSRRNSR